jgi:L-galactose dehydrogenase/L-glyceraldehyde 3-phosphate reductase
VVEDLDDPAGAVARSIEESLARLRLDSVDVIHLHNRVARQRGGNVGSGPLLALDDVLRPGGVLDGLRKAKEQGKTRAIGLCGFGGEVPCVNEAIDSGGFDSILVYFNLLNPTAGMEAPPGFQGADYGRIMTRAAARGMGVVVLRILAGGALTGQTQRHPLAGARPAADYQAEVAKASKLQFLVESGEETMAQAAIRFGLLRPEVSTVLVGVSAPEHLDAAAACSGAAPFPAGAMARLAELQRTNFEG